MAGTYGDASREMPWYKAADRSSWRALLASNLGWTFDGYETYILVLTGPAVIATLLSPEQTPIYFGILLAVTLAGWTVGGIGGGLVADRIGRKRTLMLSIFLYAIFTGLTALSPSILVFAIFRFLAGIGIGAEWGAGAVLVSEKFPNYARGRAAAILQSGFGVGFLLASIAWYSSPRWVRNHGDMCICSGSCRRFFCCTYVERSMTPKSGSKPTNSAAPLLRKPQPDRS